MTMTVIVITLFSLEYLMHFIVSLCVPAGFCHLFLNENLLYCISGTVVLMVIPRKTRLLLSGSFKVIETDTDLSTSDYHFQRIAKTWSKTEFF